MDKTTIKISSVPYGITTSSLIDSIIKANDNGKIKIKNIEDNTAENIDIIWIGAKQGIEKKLVEKEKIHIDFIDFSGVRGKGLLIIMKLPLKLIRATYQAFKILKKT